MRLPCILQPHIAPSLTWLINGHELSLDNPKYAIDNTSIEFYANAKDSGIYECRALVDDKFLLQESVLVIFSKFMKLTSFLVLVNCENFNFSQQNRSFTQKTRKS